MPIAARPRRQRHRYARHDARGGGQRVVRAAAFSGSGSDRPISSDSRCDVRTIVGVVGDIRFRGLERDDSEPQVYLAAIAAARRLAAVLRAAGSGRSRTSVPPATLMPAVRAIIRERRSATADHQHADARRGRRRSKPRRASCSCACSAAFAVVGVSARGDRHPRPARVHRRRALARDRRAHRARRQGARHHVDGDGPQHDAGDHRRHGRRRARLRRRPIDAGAAVRRRSRRIRACSPPRSCLSLLMALAGSLVPAWRAIRVDPMTAHEPTDIHGLRQTAEPCAGPCIRVSVYCPVCPTVMRFYVIGTLLCVTVVGRRGAGSSRHARHLRRPREGSGLRLVHVRRGVDRRQARGVHRDVADGARRARQFRADAGAHLCRERRVQAPLRRSSRSQRSRSAARRADRRRDLRQAARRLRKPGRRDAQAVRSDHARAARHARRRLEADARAVRRDGEGRAAQGDRGDSSRSSAPSRSASAMRP